MKLPGVTQINFGLDKRDDHLHYWKERKEIVIKWFQHSFFLSKWDWGNAFLKIKNTAQYWYRQFGIEIGNTLNIFNTLSQNYHVKSKKQSQGGSENCQDFLSLPRFSRLLDSFGWEYRVSVKTCRDQSLEKVLFSILTVLKLSIISQMSILNITNLD